MSQPNQNRRRTSIQIILGSLLLIMFVALLLLLIKYRKVEYETLTTNIAVGDGVHILYEGPSLDQAVSEDPPNIVIEKTSIHAVSTGKVSGYKMKDSNSGVHIANASILTVVTKDDNGNNKTIKILLQMFPVESPDLNIYPNIVQILSQINPELISDNNKLTNTQLKEAFPRGTEWYFIPLIDPSLELLTEEGGDEYDDYISKYYGDEVSQIKKFIESGLTEKFDNLLLIKGVSVR